MAYHCSSISVVLLFLFSVSEALPPVHSYNDTNKPVEFAVNISTSGGGCEALEHIAESVQSFCALNSTHTCSQVWDDMSPGCYVLAQSILVALVILVLVVLVVCCYCCYQRYKRNRYSHLEQRNEARLEQEQKERGGALELAKTLWRDSEYKYKEKLPDLGSRLQKYWYIMEGGEIQTIAPCSKKCRLPLHDQETMATVSELLAELKHPYLHTITGIRYDASGQVSILQPFIKQGSLRDKMFNTKPTKDWNEKYTQPLFKPFTLEEIAECGRHVLKAVLFLYEVGFPPLGHIQSGNIFYTDRGYVLGGYENTLLGYRTRLYKDLEKDGLLNMIDVIMFGHVIFEMASGLCSPEGVVLDEIESGMVKYAKVKEVLEYIFNENKWKKNPNKRISKILKLKFFQNDREKFEKPKKKELSKRVKKVLRTVREEKPVEKAPVSRDGKFSEIKPVYGIQVLKADFMEYTEHYTESYSNRKPLKRLGQRTEKVWGKATSCEHGEGLLTICPVPNTCPIFVEHNMTAIKELLTLKHPCLLPFSDVHHNKLDQQHVLVLFHPLHRKGSIKDIIHSSDPLEQWEDKYKGKGKTLFTEEAIARYGRQILEGLVFLRAVGFPSVGCVHTGNTFIEGEGPESSCVLGGYEGTLLGYRPQYHDNLKENIDIIMFGHVVFEMSTGKELKSTMPREQDYRVVPTKTIREMLKFIFKEEDGQLVTSLDQVIKDHHFFDKNHLSSKEVKTIKSAKKGVRLSKGARVLLQKVCKGKSRDQNNFVEKTKDKVKQKFRQLPNVLQAKSPSVSSAGGITSDNCINVINK